MRLFLLIVAAPFLVSLVFGWGAFPIVCGLYFVGVFSAAILRVFGVDLLGKSFCWGPPPNIGITNVTNVTSSSTGMGMTNPSTGLPMAGGVDVGGNAFGAGRRDY